MTNGACSLEDFEIYFHKHLENMTWLCTDANRIYSQYADKYPNSFRHYVRPSYYLDNYKKGIEDNNKSKKELYEEQFLDYIDAYGKTLLPYEEFTKLKKEYKLGLGRVNQYHEQLKLNLVKRTNGINLVHIQKYLDWHDFLRNFQVDFNRKPSTKKDAELIFEKLLLGGKYIKTNDISNKKPDFSRSSTQYKKSLANITKNVRSQSLVKLSNYYLTSEDCGPNFQLSEFLESLPVYALKELGKELKIKGYSTAKPGKTYKLRKELEKHPNIHDAIIHYRINHPSKNE